ncbi:MAG: SRPBCC family protein [Actinomycetota bacterium]
MKPPDERLAYHEAGIHIHAEPETVYNMISDIERMGEWSPEAVGGTWLNGGTGRTGDWFEGHNRSGEREWTRECEVANAEPGRDFTFVVGGVEANCTWWSYELAEADGGTAVTERWWIVNKTPAMAAATEEQFAARVELTETMLHDTLAALKQAAEGGG